MALDFTLMVTLVTGLLIGLLPAMQASGVNVAEALKEAGRGSSGRAVIFVPACSSSKSRCRWSC